MSKTDMPDIGRIKYWSKLNKKDVRFGEVQRWNDDAEKYWKEGKVLIEDPVTGQETLASLSDIEYEKMPYSWDEQDPDTYLPTGTEYDRYINDALKEHRRKSDEAGEGLVKDKMFTVPVADGCAYYVVTKVNKKTCNIEWRGFCLDQWHDGTLGWGGSFPIHCIEHHCNWVDARKKMFA